MFLLLVLDKFIYQWLKSIDRQVIYNYRITKNYNISPNIVQSYFKYHFGANLIFCGNVVITVYFH